MACANNCWSVFFFYFAVRVFFPMRYMIISRAFCGRIVVAVAWGSSIDLEHGVCPAWEGCGTAWRGPPAGSPCSGSHGRAGPRAHPCLDPPETGCLHSELPKTIGWLLAKMSAMHYADARLPHMQILLEVSMQAVMRITGDMLLPQIKLRPGAFHSSDSRVQRELHRKLACLQSS